MSLLLNLSKLDRDQILEAAGIEDAGCMIETDRETLLLGLEEHLDALITRVF